ncbi:MAG: 4-(cytidine 5'-diphospho)-2-C-methyl-D-erythritol kinase [Clostridia bacterium]|nr:4-(cytidine 5'-diphospho)-2-C-methyl-D-erythritol kinase [Clostridia bacterium]
MILSLTAYAKINLYLDVHAKRSDGYHDLVSVMQQVSLSDTVSAERTESGITITCTDPAIPTDERNIAHKCARAFFDFYRISGGVKIAIEKHIPAAAGLAGGSTDGAAVLTLLNRLYGTGADIDTLCEIGAKVGADIPFCIRGGTCICEGIGEILTPLTLPKKNYRILIVFPGDGVSTAEAFRNLDSTPDDSAGHSIDDVLAPLKAGKIPVKLYNSFERAIFPVHPTAAKVKSTLLANGAITAMMSGSGPSVFGLFDSEAALDSAADVLRSAGFAVYPCEPV